MLLVYVNPANQKMEISPLSLQLFHDAFHWLSFFCIIFVLQFKSKCFVMWAYNVFEQVLKMNSPSEGNLKILIAIHFVLQKKRKI